MALGLAVALSGLWMTAVYTRQPGTGDLAHLFRLTFGSALAGCLVLGLAAIRRGDVSTHQAWMTRAYALALRRRDPDAARWPSVRRCSARACWSGTSAWAPPGW